MNRRFKHDCDSCIYLGRHADHDVYRCPQMGMPTIVARFGDDGPDYTSGQRVVVGMTVIEPTATGYRAYGQSSATVGPPMPIPDWLVAGEHHLTYAPATAAFLDTLPAWAREHPGLNGVLAEIEGETIDGGGVLATKVATLLRHRDDTEAVS